MRARYSRPTCHKGMVPHVVRELWLFGPLEPNRWVEVTALFHLKVAAMPGPTNQADGRDRIEEQMRAMNGITDEEGNMAYREGFRYLTIG